MNNEHLQEFDFVVNEFGWIAKIPGSPQLLGQEVTLFISTFPEKAEECAGVSKKQAELLRSIVPSLTELLKRVEYELVAYNKDSDPEFYTAICNPQVWLNIEDNDDCSWQVVVQRSDSPDFGYHAEFKGVEFVELWAAD